MRCIPTVCASPALRWKTWHRVVGQRDGSGGGRDFFLRARNSVASLVGLPFSPLILCLQDAVRLLCAGLLTSSRSRGLSYHQHLMRSTWSTSYETPPSFTHPAGPLLLPPLQAMPVSPTLLSSCHFAMHPLQSSCTIYTGSLRLSRTQRTDDYCPHGRRPKRMWDSRARMLACLRAPCILISSLCCCIQSHKARRAVLAQGARLGA